MVLRLTCINVGISSALPITGIDVISNQTSMCTLLAPPYLYVLSICWTNIYFYLTAVAAEGELQILGSTDSLHFDGHERLSQDTLKEVLSASLGFTIEKVSGWFKDTGWN